MTRSRPLRWLRAAAVAAVLLGAQPARGGVSPERGGGGGSASGSPPVAGAPARKQAKAPRPYDAAAVARRAGVKDPHDHGGKPFCGRCHAPGSTRAVTDPIALCAGCHDAGMMRHPFRMEPGKDPGDLPLMEGGLVACHTCHDPHDVKAHRAGLRLPYKDLCLRCHASHGSTPHQPNPHHAGQPSAAPANPHQAAPANPHAPGGHAPERQHP